ncbi:type II secretion system protein [Clostridium thermosuccinogenes]|uniref:Type II secretion system protein n=1 Tax=Clostridium thermosuccinogenes TaxID=84032 RepID=A0A2K2EWN1_9CLOT|nr:type II secretion system F family protein [Pseudoclostridium thermosuccinogenes]AUS98408.1 type II secretion system protein [Pseudoclostridium thermosuccinogenes]PNT90943.1 type II secretion system protein [Pseudoclostridium thermosuccinogenes]PNT98912.1 type II secretion system protein [Pseudoclostridium thermosuccinogenes]PNU00827.1 type II secretion system protein [Pseudoclostridium thermosuccinogenes]
MVFVFGAEVLLLAVLYILSRGKYDSFIAAVDRERYPFYALMPIALLLLDKFKHDYNTQYDRKLMIKIIEISGIKYSQFYIRVHWANKIVLLMLSLLFISFIALFVEMDTGFIIFSIALILTVAYLSDNELKEKIKKRRLAIQMDFPDFLNKLILLIDAGMTVTRAWEKAVEDNKKGGVLYSELETVLAEIKSGKSEYQAYEDFSKRCRTPEVTRFMSALIQNLRKGNSDIVSVLRLQSNECWMMRKNAAKRLGEEASTKLIFPMMLILIAILIIVATPALLAMQGI